MLCLSIILSWCIKVVKHQRCLFAVINENGSALIIGSNLNHFFCDDEWVKMGLFRSDAQLNIYVHRFCPSSRDLTVPDKPDPSGSSRRRVLFENLSIFLKQTIPWRGDFLMFLIAYFIPPKGNSSVKTISIFADNDFFPLGRYIFRRRKSFIKNGTKYE